MTTVNDAPVALATCMELPAVAPDDLVLQQALQAIGIEAVAASWNDPGIDWHAFAGVVVRSTWDYHKQHARFAGWLDHLESAAIALLNPVGAIRWNLDKRYLLELSAKGVEIIPTRVCQWERLDEVSRAHRGESLVIKPTISGNSWQIARGIGGSTPLERAIDGLPHHLSYLVQPYLPEVQTEGEWSLVFIDGHYSHAVRKRPAQGDFRVQPDFGGVAVAESPPAALLADAEACLQAIHALGHGRLAYARVDGIVHQGRLRLMEVELIEPTLFLQSHPASAATLAAVIARRLGREGHDR